MLAGNVLGESHGVVVDDDGVERLAAEAEAGYDPEVLRGRRRGGRPAMGSGPAPVVPVRLDPELKARVAARAENDHTSMSEVIREALRRSLDVA